MILLEAENKTHKLTDGPGLTARAKMTTKQQQNKGFPFKFQLDALEGLIVHF